jgi:hypothetical protein
VFWEVTLDDIRAKIRLHIGQQQALVIQNFQTLNKVVALAFGAPEKERPKEVQSKGELKAKFAAIFGSK